MKRLNRCVAIGLVALPGIAIPFWAGVAGEPSADAVEQHMYTNRLIDSNDPYLLLHAHNPVDWYPWGDEALARAKRENRPIFLSVGYSTCYWCHVAERLIYSDPEIAKLMNRWFVNIKVDREQRPDLDSIYMLSTQTITGRGGWPNNVFLTPDLKPFYAGSYFPPADEASGRPGFATVLTALHEAWVNRPQEVADQAERIYRAMLEARRQVAAETVASIDPRDWLNRAREALVQGSDPTYGGFSGGPAKFPRAPALGLLLADSEDPRALQVLTKTLDAMALGGMHDQLGGGFHRYATERTWSIPHFEKMLYDNAQLLGLYAQAYRITHNPLYRQVAQDVADYLAREMMAPGGGFFAAQDAEVDGREGASYLWKQSEIESILGADAARRFLDVYALTPIPRQRGNNANEEGGVLRVRLPVAETVQRAGGQEISQVLASLAPARARLLEARSRRAQPARDDKIVVAWNALAIDALVQGGTVLQDRRLVAVAERSANRLWQDTFDSETGELKHELFGGRAQIQGYLDDYALLGIAFMSLADATGDTDWRNRAASLANSMLRRFADGDTLATSVASSDLLIPPLDDGDNTAPSGTSAAIELLARMHRATGQQDYADAAVRIVARLSGTLAQDPGQWPSTVTALNRYPLPAANNTANVDTPPRLSALSTADHVHARGEVRSAGNRDEIKVTVVIDEGYHINANPATFDYLIPATLSIDGVWEVEVIYPSGKLIKPQFAPDGLKVYEGTIVVTGTAPGGALVSRNRITAALRVQACNDEVCLPPATLPLEIERR